MTPEEYDKLSPEERDIKDKEDRARERREQAGIHDRIYPQRLQTEPYIDQLSPTHGNKNLVKSTS